MTPKQFKEARHTLGLSVAKMAEALSDPDGDSTAVNPRTIRRWEAGEREISSPAIVEVYALLLMSNDNEAEGSIYYAKTCINCLEFGFQEEGSVHCTKFPNEGIGLGMVCGKFLSRE